MTASKDELRGLVRRIEAGITPEEKRLSDSVFMEKLLACPAFCRAGTVFLYVGVGTEPDTRPAIAAALAAGKTVALPRITGPGVMEARRIGALDGLVPDRFGIPAPPEDSETVPPCAFDLILVPGAAFTLTGRRLGRGGGYYDRYLPGTRALKLALARRALLFPEIPTEPYDVPVDIVITDAP